MPLTPFQSQITFQSYDNLDRPAEFYGGFLGLEMVFNQEMVRIYRTADHAFIGVVKRAHGYQRVKDENSVVISLTVENVDGWYDHLKNSDVKILTELREQKRAPVRSFYFEDPGGYSLEIQEFTRPEDKEAFS
jgi:catechol 2,3-dioxygenase-like lactoylglutathione lyase family enzyme